MRRSNFRHQRRQIGGTAQSLQSHLENQGVGKNDLFLFFGLFRQTEGDAKNLKFAKGSPDIHTIWGWLQIDKAIRVDKNTARQYPQHKDHPHVEFPEQEANNTIYIARKTLKIDGISRPLPGFGVFSTFDARLQLTTAGKNPSTWCLPRWFEGKLSYHSEANRWSPCDGDKSRVMLDAVGRGQEFVIVPDDTAAAVEWLRSIFDCAKS